MDIQIIEKICDAVKVIIHCNHTDDNVLRLKRHIELFDEKIQAKRENEWFLMDIADVLYFESVDNRTFLYTEQEVLEIKQRLYELEASLPNQDFLKISKSEIVNLGKIVSLKPEMNRTITATLCNKEQLCVSRKYVPTLKDILKNYGA